MKKEGFKLTIKGTVTRIFVEKDSGFKIVVVTVNDKSVIPSDMRNPDFPDSFTAVGVLKGVDKDYVVEFGGEWEKRRPHNKDFASSESSEKRIR